VPAPLRSVAYIESGPGSSVVTGAQVAEQEFVRALTRYGSFEELSIFSADGDAEDSDRTAGNRVRFRRFSELPSFVADTPPDAVQIPYLFSSQIAYLRERFGAKPFPITGVVHAIAHPDAKLLLYRNLLTNSHELDVAICPSRSVQKALHGLADQVGTDLGVKAKRPRTAVIPLGIETERFRPGDKSSLRAQNGLPQDACIILYVGRLNPWTKADLLPLIVAFARLRKQLPGTDVQLLIVGQEQAAGYAAALAGAAQALGVQDDVQIWTGVPSGEMSQVFQMADIFAAPSDNLQETFGITLLEAMASGLPVVAAEWNGYRDIVEEGTSGFLVPTYVGPPLADVVDAAIFAGYRTTMAHAAQTTALDVPILVERLSRLVNNEQLRRGMGERGRATVRDRYAWPIVITAYEELWREQARRAAARGKRRARPVRPFSVDLARQFRHYGSAQVESLRSLRRSSASERLPDAVLSQIAKFAAVDWDAATRMLDRLPADRREVSLRDLTQAADDERAVHRAIAFLLKHGVIERAPPATGRRKPKRSSVRRTTS
jgi:D-inositol-3-phosphate glycosyltransferase